MIDIISVRQLDDLLSCKSKAVVAVKSLSAADETFLEKFTAVATNRKLSRSPVTFAVLNIDAEDTWTALKTRFDLRGVDATVMFLEFETKQDEAVLTGPDAVSEDTFLSHVTTFATTPGLITSESCFKSVVRTTPNVVVAFESEQCSLSRVVMPKYRELQTMYGSVGCVFCRVDVVQTPNIAAVFGVEATPAFFFYSNKVHLEELNVYGDNMDRVEDSIS
eukprot:PhM_4_TR13721/c0_g1_i1/m.40014